MRAHHLQRGISLIEALVAMACMAFGMLAMLGLQTTLRSNSDISKQRSEAVRMAQQTVEELRTFSAIATTGGANAYQDIGTADPEAVDLGSYTSSASASFTRAITVVEIPSESPSDFEKFYLTPQKTVTVKVSWTDRNNEAQETKFTSIISRSSPEIVGALSVDLSSSLVRRPQARNFNIPPSATPSSGLPGTSTFAPPGAPTGTVWYFNNATARIERICVGETCTTTNSLLLSGYIRFADTTSAPTSIDSESPPSPIFTGMSLGVVVDLTEPTTSLSRVDCFVDPSFTTVQDPGPPASYYAAYYCAIPVDDSSDPDFVWSGQSNVTLNGNTSGGMFASSIADYGPDKFRVCRYTTYRNNVAPDPPLPNINHPLNYTDVSGPLSNQNFLVIRAGLTAPFACPDDDTSTPVNGATWHHQPSS